MKSPVHKIYLHTKIDLSSENVAASVYEFSMDDTVYAEIFAEQEVTRIFVDQGFILER